MSEYNYISCENEYYRPTSLLFVLLTLSMSFIPLSSMGNYLRLGIVSFQFLLMAKSGGITSGMKNIFTMMLLSLILPVLPVLLFEGTINFSIWMHEAIRLVFNIILIVVVSRYRIPFKWVLRSCLFLLIFNTTIQILQYRGYAQVSQWIRQYYLVEGASDIHLYLASGVEGFRSGSIYMNPNVYMVIPLITLAVILQANVLKPRLINYFWVAVCFISLVLTGSRTTLVVAGIVTILYFFIFDRTGALKWIILGALIVFLVTNWSVLSQEFRAFNVSEGMDDSFAVKTGGLIAYIRNSNIVYWLTGSLSSMLNVQIDAEWGYIFKFYGLFGIVWYIKLLKSMNINYYSARFMTIASISIVALVSLTATVVLCMAVFPFVCLVVFAEVEV